MGLTKHPYWQPRKFMVGREDVAGTKPPCGRRISFMEVLGYLVEEMMTCFYVSTVSAERTSAPAKLVRLRTECVKRDVPQ